MTAMDNATVHGRRGYGRHRTRSRRRGMLVLLAVLGLAIAVGGGTLMWRGTHTPPPTAPTIDTAWAISPSDIASLPEPEPASVAAAAGGTKTVPSPDDMAPGTVLVPSLGIYAPTDASTITDSVLQIPDNPIRVGVWDGHAVVIAGHVNQAGVWGALAPLTKIQPGASLWRKDNAGRLTHWRATGIAVTQAKTAHPYFTPSTNDTPDVLYAITCGGPFTNGHYRDNITATFRASNV